MIFLIFLITGVVYASLFEWVLHRYVMHRPLGWLRFPYEKHAQTHHRIFRADDSYHLRRAEDRLTIPMAWWSGMVLVATASSPFWLAGWLLGSLVAPLGVTVALTCCYTEYEYLHWCMHLPKGRWFERTWLFRKINGHHLLHHAFHGCNYNVTWPPIGDFVFRTLRSRSRAPFDQATGPS